MREIADGVPARVKEFWTYVWDHTIDPFQTSFDDCPALSPGELVSFSTIIAGMRRRSAHEAAVALKAQVDSDPHMLMRVVQLVGLTRNKVLTDLRASAKGRPGGKIVGTTFAGLTKPASWVTVGPYLSGRLVGVLSPLFEFKSVALHAALESLNRATWPGYARQERAKRSGHEAERRLASMLRSCGVPFDPPGKDTNPMGGDVMIGDVSFDLVVPSLRKPLVCFKATVHTSNIGQYGESKDHLELDQARKRLSRNYPRGRRPTLMALIDGVGFTSNAAGLKGVLTAADEFCQYRTLWKAAVVCLHRLRRSMQLYLPEGEPDVHRAFLHRYTRTTQVHKVCLDAVPPGAVPVGDAFLLTAES